MIKSRSSPYIPHLRIGFAHDRPKAHINGSASESVEAEYEDEKTLSWMRSTLGELGYVIDIEWGTDSISRVDKAKIDVIFNITEAGGSRNRESLIPALAEAANIPFTGTDAVGLGMSLNKYLTKTLAEKLEIPTPRYIRVDSEIEIKNLASRLENFRYPLIVKPNTGGASMGIKNTSKVDSFSDLVKVIKWLLKKFSDRILIEEFVTGREFTVGLLEMPKLEVLHTAEICFADGNEDSFYSFEMKSIHGKEIICPAQISCETDKLMKEYSVKIFRELGCKDIGRVDFRLGCNGVPYLLEINPLPGLSPFYSIFPIQAKAYGLMPEEVIYQLISNAVVKLEKGDYIFGRK